MLVHIFCKQILNLVLIISIYFILVRGSFNKEPLFPDFLKIIYIFSIENISQTRAINLQAIAKIFCERFFLIDCGLLTKNTYFSCADRA